MALENICSRAESLDDRFKFCVISMTALFAVPIILLLVLLSTSVIMATVLQTFTIIGLLVSIYLFIVRLCYINFEGVNTKIKRRRIRSDRLRNRENSLANYRNNLRNNCEIDFTSHPTSVLFVDLPSVDSLADNAPHSDFIVFNQLNACAPEIDEQRSPGPPSYEDVIKTLPVFGDDQPPGYCEAMKLFNK